MAELNFDGLLGNLFGGGGDSELEKLLTAKQKEQLGLQSTMAAAAALLQASGRSPQRIGLGQALGSALQAGQSAYEKGTAGAFQNLLLGAKLREMQTEAAGNESWKNLIGGKTQPTTALTPEQAALAAPTTVAGPAGPTVARAQLAQQMPAPVATSTDPLAFLNPTQRALIGGMPRKEGLPEVLKIAQSQAEYGPPTPVVMNGKTVMLQYNKLGQSKVAEGATPYEAQSPDIRAVEYISGRPLAGTGTAGIGQVGEYRKQIAPTTKVDVKLPPGQSQFVAGAGTETIKVLGELTQGARSANDTLINVEKMLPALDKAILGPAADYRTTMLRIGQQLGVAGADANEQLANTRIVVQGLAQQELDAAAQMRGQGSLTEGERGILRRAAAGDQTLSAAEIRQALASAQKTARYRLATQEDYLNRAMKIPGFEQFAPMYQVTPYGGGGGGGGNPLLDAVNRQLQLRSSGGPR
jgi:hypothetical protein